MTYQSALTALADPTRRQIFEHLTAGPQAVGALAKGLPVSRPAVSQHLKVLSDAGLVMGEVQGRSTIYRACPEGLEALRRYLDGLWDDVLGAFAASFSQENISNENTSQENTSREEGK